MTIPHRTVTQFKHLFGWVTRVEHYRYVIDEGRRKFTNILAHNKA